MVIKSTGPLSPADIKSLFALTESLARSATHTLYEMIKEDK